MNISRDPLFRRKEQPLYLVVPVYALFFLVTAALIALGVIGIEVAAGEQRYREHIWVPVLLVISASVLFFGAAARLIRRRNSESGH